MKGQLPVYQTLQNNPHPCLPRVYEVNISEDSTTVIEEYIEGQASGAVELDEKQFLNVVRELCSVLEFLHGKGIVHRDIKPSNLLLTGEGHVYLIDFDAARMRKEEQEQDTRLLGTRGYAPPEQYGFAQTDERTDIYAMGATLKQLLGEKNQKPRYKRIIQKCMRLDPDRRYQSIRQVRHAFLDLGRRRLYCFVVLLALVSAGYCAVQLCVPKEDETSEMEAGQDALTVLPPPENPHWDNETGSIVWGNVPESGVGDEVWFHLRLYKRETETPPNADDSDWYFEQRIRIGGGSQENDVQSWNLASKLEENGFYYFSMSAEGDGLSYADSSWVISDCFEYTGENAPPLPVPEGLAWRMVEVNNSRRYYATWSNLDDYEDGDYFNVTFYDETGAYVMNNTWPKKVIDERGYGGIPIPTEFLISGPGKAYRFIVQVYSSRPNEYHSSPMPDPVPEEYYSPWLYYGSRSDE